MARSTTRNNLENHIIKMARKSAGPIVGCVNPDKSHRWALSGFLNGTVWFSFVAFMFGLGYEQTGLGLRIASMLSQQLGGTLTTPRLPDALFVLEFPEQARP
jgi:di/tricarboxylate transporter